MTTSADCPHEINGTRDGAGFSVVTDEIDATHVGDCVRCGSKVFMRLRVRVPRDA